MKIIRDIADIPSGLPFPVLTLGNFDGVHRGHQALLTRVCQRAEEMAGTPMVLTFDPHPLKVLAPEKCPVLITTTSQKMRLLQRYGIAITICLPFTREFANWEAERFVEEILHRRIGVKEIYVGYDFAFGRGRQGTPALLESLGATAGFAVKILAPVQNGGGVVSSTRIRHLVQRGAVQEASRLLGRPYMLEGEVIPGFRKGTELGFPTANIRPANELIPANGVYVTETFLQGHWYASITNIGVNPTFQRDQRRIEVHLFDFSRQIYGEQVELAFLEKIRDERRFPSVTALVEQIASDVRYAQAFFRRHTTFPQPQENS
ncbi:MAG: bifunctional riboflavin kinase/FAD synthetase [Nitrospinota bacterium]|nr:MAG: bifunctional riboflavin kinase/FAD synthetase [Nitrospinota bacterium]